jgi:hypothetical protein
MVAFPDSGEPPMQTHGMDRRTWITFWTVFVALWAFNLGQIEGASHFIHRDLQGVFWSVLCLAIGAYNALKPVWQRPPES